ncbi:MAG: YchJ family protein [Armatimonadetes bacterium]|nr:YchJ family protein [Armatimonadota bacterium]
MSCDCGSGASREECCGRFLSGQELPRTAEELMRSRYTAYKLGNFDYMARTQVERFDWDTARKWSGKVEWEGLSVRSVENGGPEDQEGTVDFEARYRLDRMRHVHREKSDFRRIHGRWHYVRGNFVDQDTVRRDTARVGRNDPCPCGSGRKYKKCCGK